jgi:hypothetical protein
MSSKRRRPRLHLVGQEPTNIFEDLDQLRDDLHRPGQRRQRIPETFARIPHDKALRLKISGTAWKVLIELDRIILKGRGQNPVRFWSPRLRALGIRGNYRTRILRQLEAAGVIIVRWTKAGHSPWVFHTWYPKQR